MVWQDIVIAVASAIFTYSLFYQVMHGFRIKRGSLTLVTSGLYTLGLIAVSIAYFTLSLFYSGIIGILSAVLWLALFMQTLIYGLKK